MEVSVSVPDPIRWEQETTPIIYELYNKFNELFFEGRLPNVIVSWSRKMWHCAGLCYNSSDCFYIALSAPLLRQRSLSDVLNTLVHEMIHVWCHMNGQFDGGDEHGPSFRREMERINREAGINIRTAHNYHQEIQNLIKHVWMCNGPCKHWAPHNGIITRAGETPPGPRDPWWRLHQEKCGGTFIKLQRLPCWLNPNANNGEEEEESSQNVLEIVVDGDMEVEILVYDDNDLPDEVPPEQISLDLIRYMHNYA